MGVRTPGEPLTLAEPNAEATARVVPAQGLGSHSKAGATFEAGGVIGHHAITLLAVNTGWADGNHGASGRTSWNQPGRIDVSDRVGIKSSRAKQAGQRWNLHSDLTAAQASPAH